MDADAVHARRAVEALRAGVPNADAVRELGSTQHEIERQFRDRLAQACHGMPTSGLLLGGDFGSGKSHVLAYLQHVAVNERFVASRIVISKETPLYDPVKVFRAAVANAVVPGRSGSAIAEISSALRFDSSDYADFYRWSDSPQAALNERFPASLYLFENLRAQDREFVDRLVRFWSGDPIAVSELKRKLRETGEAATWALSRVSSRDLALQRFRFLAAMIRAAGFAGWVLLFDEVELIGRYSPLQRGRSYAEVVRWLKGSEAEPLEGAFSVLAITKDFASEVIEGKLDSQQIPLRLRDRGEESLALRAERGMQAIEEELVKLTPPDNESLPLTYDKLKRIHARAYKWLPPDVTHPDSLGSRQMREYVRAWINEWDLRRMYPEYRPEIEISGLTFDYGEDADLGRQAGDSESPASD